MHDPFQVWAQEGNVLGFSDLGYEQAAVPGESKVKGVAEIEMGRKQNFLRKRGNVNMSVFSSRHLLLCVRGHL